MQLSRLWLALVCMIALLAPSAHATAQGDANERATAAYRGGDLETARTLWTELLAAGPSEAERARLTYDLGNVAFRAQKPLEAVGWYTASLRLRPRDDDTWANLEHARREAGLEPADRGDLSATARRLLEAPTAGESVVLALVSALVFGVFLAFEALRGGRTWRRLAWLGAVCALAGFAPFLWQRASAERDPVLTIAPKERALVVHSEPRADAAAIATLPPGERRERLDQLGDWTRIELDGGASGWARSNELFALHR